MVQTDFMLVVCIMFLALAHWSRAEGNVHEENYYPSIDARQILFGQPTMTIPSSALPPSYMPMGQAPPCHSIDAQNTDNPCSPLLYSLTPEQAQNMMVTPDNRHTIPSVYRYPYANNQFRIDTPFPTIPDDDVPSQYSYA